MVSREARPFVARDRTDVEIIRLLALQIAVVVLRFGMGADRLKF